MERVCLKEVVIVFVFANGVDNRCGTLGVPSDSFITDLLSAFGNHYELCRQLCIGGGLSGGLSVLMP